MKKTSILLSSMVVASGTLGVVGPIAMAETSENRENLINTLNTDPLSGENLRLASEGGKENTIFLEENAKNPDFKFLSVDFAKNEIGVERSRDWKVKQLTLVYRDYEKGVTEEEADAKLVTLGEGSLEGWKTLFSQESNKIGAAYQLYLIAMDGGRKVQLKQNLTDVMYYAVQYGRQTEVDGQKVWEDTWWTRGKINYRECAHSQVFDRSAMICTMGNDGKLNIKNHDYTLVEKPENDEIMSWNEEWNGILRQKYEDLRIKLITLNDNLRNVMSILSDANYAIEGLELTLPKAEELADKDTLIEGNAEMKRLSESIKAYYDSLRNAASSTELNNLRAEKMELTRQVENLTARLKQLELDKTELQREKDDVIQQKEELEREKAEWESKYQVLVEEKAGWEKLKTELEGEKEEWKKVQAEFESEKRKLMQEMADYQGKSVELERKNAELEQRVAELLATQKDTSKVEQNGAQNGQNSEQKNELTTDAQVTSKQEKNDNDGRKIEVKTEYLNGYENQDEASLEMKKDEKESKDAEVKQGKETEQNEAEVPNLGEIEEASKALWWLAIPGVGLGLLLLGVLYRLTMHKQKKAD